MPSNHVFPPYTYQIPVETYLEAYNMRFPQHELFPYILDSETISKEVDPDTGNWTQKRKIKLDINAPSWFKKISGLHFVIFIEDTTFDISKRKASVFTVNETLSTKCVVTDTSSYEPHPDNPNWTVFTQSGECDLIMSAFGFQSRVEKMFLGTYASRYEEARKLDLVMIERLLKLKSEKNRARR